MYTKIFTRGRSFFFHHKIYIRNTRGLEGASELLNINSSLDLWPEKIVCAYTHKPDKAEACKMELALFSIILHFVCMQFPTRRALEIYGHKPIKGSPNSFHAFPKGSMKKHILQLCHMNVAFISTLGPSRKIEFVDFYDVFAAHKCSIPAAGFSPYRVGFTMGNYVYLGKLLMPLSH